MLGLVLLALSASPVQWLGPAPKLPATRVVTLAPSVTETLLALGARDTLVGVSRFDEFPEVQGLPRAGGFNDVSVETIVALEPGVVVVQKAPGNQKAVETLARLGVSVLALPLTSVEDVSVAMAELGRVVGKGGEAAALVAELKRAREAAHAARPKTPKTVLFVYGFEPLVVAGPGSFAHELLEDCGAKNLAERAPSAYPTFSLERALVLAPDVVVDAADVKEGKQKLQHLGSLGKARWVEVKDQRLLHPGPALAKALPGLCALVK